MRSEEVCGGFCGVVDVCETRKLGERAGKGPLYDFQQLDGFTQLKITLSIIQDVKGELNAETMVVTARLIKKGGR